MTLQKYKEKMKYPIRIKGKTIKQVTKLNLSGLGLKQFPENLFEYTNLTKLVLSNNRIKVIPKEILKLKKLKSLDLANNEIKVLQSAVFKLPKLRTLNLYGNQIVKFPEQIKGTGVQKLIIGKNPIEKEELDKLTGIEVVRPYSETIMKLADISDVEIKHIVEETVINEVKIMEKKQSIFISYSHKDAEWLEMVSTHLKPLSRYYGIDEWDDQKLRTSDRWKEEITKALNHATIAILLFSPDFMASDFIINNELQPLLENAHKGGVKIMPIMVRPCAAFEESGLSDYQATNGPDKTLVEMTKGEVDRTLKKLYEDIKYFVGQKK